MQRQTFSIICEFKHFVVVVGGGEFDQFITVGRATFQ